MPPFPPLLPLLLLLTTTAERLAAAEQQLEATRTQAEANLQSEMSSHSQELDGVRSDYSTQLAAAAAKVSAQMREISELHTKVASAEALQTRVRIDMERKTDEAVVAAREGEKVKAEQTINDLRQRLQVCGVYLPRVDPPPPSNRNIREAS